MKAAPRPASIVMLAALALAACGEARDGNAQAPVRDESASAQTLALGRKIYNFRCYFCHGYSGDAKTLASTFLSPPPRDFTAAAPGALAPGTIVAALREGRPGTAMKSFNGILDDAQMRAVAAFVTNEFVLRKAPNTSYHTPENGWPDHARFSAAFGFATGALKLDAPVESLDAEQLRGRRLFLSACVSCHDRAHVSDTGPAWSARPLSYPRMGFTPAQTSSSDVDAVSGASVYARHDVAPRIAGLSTLQRKGERLFQANCAFCHGADGTGKNWIGQFMEPKARDLTGYTAQTMPLPRLRQTIRDGLPGTSMPAWKSVLDAAQIDAISAYVSRAFFRRVDMPTPDT